MTSAPTAGAVASVPTSPGARPPGRPRSVAAERAIINAVLQLVAEQGFDGLSVEGVAARAGVGKGTIYRRWPGKEAMLVDALASVSEELPALPADGSIRDGLVEMVDTIRSSTQSTPAGRLLPKVMAAVSQYPDVIEAYRGRVVDARAQALRELLARGVHQGELRPDLDIDMAVTLLVGPVLYLVMMRSGGSAIDRSACEGLVDGVLDGLRA